MLSKISYPWFFFYRMARLSALIFLPTLFIILFFYRSSYKEGLISQMTLQTEDNLKAIRETQRLSQLDWKIWCKNLSFQSSHYSLIQADGTIICENHKLDKGQKLLSPKKIESNLGEDFNSFVQYNEHFNTQSLFAVLKLADGLFLQKITPIASLKDDMNRFDRIIFLKIVPFALVSYIIFLFLFYIATRPLGTILTKLGQIQVEIPFNKELNLFYKKNEWLQIQEAIGQTDLQLRTQILNVKKENEKITAILESINDDIVAIDTYETILFYNSNFQQNFMQKKSYQEIVPKLWHAFSDQTVLDAFRSVLKNGETISLKSLTFLSSSGPEKFFDFTITPLSHEDGKVSGALGVLYDVTDFKMAEKMRVDFVANVSHEIRTPLTSIKGYTQVLDSQKSKIDPSLHLFLEKILSNTERMISLFNDLLNLSVIESKNIMASEELDLKELVHTIVSNMRTIYPSKNIRFIEDIQLHYLNGDLRLMEQVLSNLVDNACKYSGDDIEIKISTYTDGLHHFITITDNGLGIPKEHIQHIFQRFYRVDSSRESKRGTGLGLSIVKHIVAKHGGRIWAESSAPHQGTRFIIELPLTS